METFPFYMHHPVTVYPKGDGFKFGGGYEATHAPLEPLQRKFKLHFSAMIWFINETTGLPENTTEPHLNMLALDEFYRRHLSWKKFIYPHPSLGNINVKFSADNPWEHPKTLKGSGGVTDEFEMILVEQP